MTTSVLLAAGVGSRLMPFTSNWPKCMFPVGPYPLLAYWLDALSRLDQAEKTLINTHYHASIVTDYLETQKNSDSINISHESKLLGTAGTLRNNYDFLKDETLIVIHADNFSNIDLNSFLKFHNSHDCPISMACFVSDTPETCGVVELDDQNKVTRFWEKKINPPSVIANAAIYCFDPVVLDHITFDEEITDISTHVIPRFIGQIKAYKSDIVNIDIGNLKNWINANKVIKSDKIKSTKINDLAIPKSVEFGKLRHIAQTGMSSLD